MNSSPITFEKVKELLGFEDKDAKQLALKLAIGYPSLTNRQIFEMFYLTCKNYHDKADEIEDSMSWYNRKFSGMTIGQINQTYDPKENFHSTYIFRNFYRVIDETDQWNDALKKKIFLSRFLKLKDDILCKSKKNYRNQRLLDLFEFTCEFIDLIEKRRHALLDEEEKAI